MNLTDLLKNYKNSELSRFHTPGHSGKAAVLSDFSQVLPFDVTEVLEFDSIYHADSCIKNIEQKAAKLFGAKRSVISVGGCTLAIQTMLALACDKNAKIAAGRNAHVSFINTCALLDLDPMWIYPKDGRVMSNDVEKALEEGAKVVYITSPDYFGRLSDIEKIADLCHEKGAVLLVDNAHGPHLKFLETDLHPLSLGADMTACSLHKTLPVLTGGAVLNINNDKFVEKAKEKMALFGSTSPSYLILASIESCFDYLETKPNFLEERVLALKKYAKENGAKMPQGECDPMRLTLAVDEKEALKNGAVADYSDGEYTVFITTPFHDETDFARLKAVIDTARGSAVQSTKITAPKRGLRLQEAYFAQSEEIAASAAIGRIAAQSVSICPPGIPLIIPGEIIDEDIIKQMQNKVIKVVKQ